MERHNCMFYCLSSSTGFYGAKKIFKKRVKAKLELK